jgi:hypothetical protein
MTSSSASDRGNSARITVLMQKGTTSKEMEVNSWTAEETLPPTALLLLAYNSVDRHWHGKRVSAAINAHATREEPLNTSTLYQRKCTNNTSQNYYFNFNTL